MGRSISVPSKAVHVVYAYLDYAGMDDDDIQYEYDQCKDNLVFALRNAFPSVEGDSGWLGREDAIVASNRYANFVLSEYCGGIAVSVVPKDDDYAAQGWYNLRDRWINRLFPKLKQAVEHAYGKTFIREGVMSNGEAVYRQAS